MTGSNGISLPGRVILLKFFRSIYPTLKITLREFSADKLLLRSLALSYGTVLSLLPLLAVLFSLFKGLGGGDWFLEVVRPSLSAFLAPGFESLFSDRVIKLLSRFSGKTIGGIGSLLLLFGLHSIFKSVESTFNLIWGGHTTKRFLSRAPIYWTLFLAIPILLVISIGFTAYVAALPLAEEVSSRISFFDSLLRTSIPGGMMIISLILLYRYLPRAKVEWQAAVMGGVATGLTYEVVKTFFVIYVANLVKFDLLYGSLIFLPMAMVWINVSWIVVLFGAELTYVIQHYEVLRREQKHIPLSRRQKEALALALLVRASEESRRKEVGWVDPATLVEEWELPPGVVDEVIARLIKKDLITIDSESSQLFRLNRSSAQFPISDAQNAMLLDIEEIWRWPDDQLWKALRNWLEKPHGRRKSESVSLDEFAREVCSKEKE